jgi:hypothetical protein
MLCELARPNKGSDATLAAGATSIRRPPPRRVRPRRKLAGSLHHGVRPRRPSIHLLGTPPQLAANVEPNLAGFRYRLRGAHDVVRGDLLHPTLGSFRRVCFHDDETSLTELLAPRPAIAVQRVGRGFEARRLERIYRLLDVFAADTYSESRHSGKPIR